MQFSGKITHAFINYGLKHQLDVMDMLDRANLTLEVASNPEVWLSSQNVEAFLALFAEESVAGTTGSIIENVGHKSPELKAWGVLDSVLKMMRSPKDLYLQPDRFLSYFVSPPPPIEKKEVTESRIVFEVPIFFDEYPNTCMYLKSCLESLTVYANKDLAQVNWVDNVISITWEQSQSSLLNEENYYFNPELVKSIIETVECNQFTIDHLRKELEQKEKELSRLKEIQASAHVEDIHWTTEDRNWFESEILKLQDYFSRAQQLVTILVGSDRKTRLVKEAMKKVRWSNVPDSFPQTIGQLRKRIREEGPIPQLDQQDTQFKLEIQ
ncbi:MAG: hypothetical protein M9899_03185 [Bdellovibrionaceae bacterium]|nr:hypothetical protein [Pseudobdellovibrionaceae bacterium]